MTEYKTKWFILEDELIKKIFFFEHLLKNNFIYAT